MKKQKSEKVRYRLALLFHSSTVLLFYSSTFILSSVLRLRRPHLRHALLKLPRNVRHDAQLPLDQH